MLGQKKKKKKKKKKILKDSKERYLFGQNTTWGWVFQAVDTEPT